MKNTGWQFPVSRAWNAILVCLVLVTTAWASTESAIYAFKGGSSDGYYPESALVTDKAGNLYGTTLTGGGYPNCSPFGESCGVVFQLVPQSGGGWKENVLYKFTGGADGGFVYNSLVMDDKGNLYGTTYLGGTPTGGCSGGTCGTVFQLSPPKKKGGAWAETVLYSFCSRSGCTDGAYPVDRLVMDKAGNLYGTTNVGGLQGGCNTSGFAGYGCGVVFKLTHGKADWKESVLYTFTGSYDGGFPDAGVVLDKADNVYGSTSAYGVYGNGIVYKLAHSVKNKKWKQDVVYSFTGGSDGCCLTTPLTLDAAGNLYGTAPGDGTFFYGTVFELKHSKTGWNEKTLYTFTGGADGGTPAASLVAKGNSFYGTTYAGGTGTGCGFAGSSPCGTVFELTRSNGTWNEIVIYSFSSGSNGALPDNAVMFDKKGNLFGTTVGGGNYGVYGVAYEITP